jgi:AcrR family transcriptional regulator
MVTDNGTTGKAERITPTVTSPITERKKERTRRDIVAAASQLFHDRGWDGTTVDDIAAAADIGTRTFYRYFSTKEDVIVDQAGRCLEYMAENLSLQPNDAALRDALRAAMRATVLALSGPSAADVIMARTEYALRARLTQRMMRAQDVLIPVIAGRIGEAPEALRTRAIAAAITTAANVALDAWADDPDAAAFVDLADEVLVMFLDGLA